MSVPAIQTKHWTRQEYDRLADAGILAPDERVELLEGEIVTMTLSMGRTRPPSDWRKRRSERRSVRPIGFAFSYPSSSIPTRNRNRT